MTGRRFFLCALLLSIGAAVAASAGAAVGEQLFQVLPEGYRVAFQKRQGNLSIVEMVPTGESENDWSEMLTTQIFFGGVSQATPEKFHEMLRSKWSAACPSAGSEIVRKGTENGYSVVVWAMTCDKNPVTSKPEVTLLKAIQGRDSFYLVQKAWRGNPDKAGIEKWSRFLAAVVVCDTREPKDHPCPKGVGEK